MLLKCMYKRVFLWNDDFTQKVTALNPEDVVLELDEKPRSRGVGSGPWVKVLHDSHTGWALYEWFEELTEPDAL